MFDSMTRGLKDRILTPIARAIPESIGPTGITLVSIVPGLAAAVFAAAGARWLGLACFVANRILDGLDGVVARERGLQSDFGGYLDIMADFAVYATIPIGMWWGAGAAAPLALVVLLAVFYVNAASWMYLAALIEKRRAADRGQTSIVMPRGLVEGTETIAAFVLFFLVPDILPILFLLMAGATAVGTGQRIAWAARALPHS